MTCLDKKVCKQEPKSSKQKAGGWTGWHIANEEMCGRLLFFFFFLQEVGL